MLLRQSGSGREHNKAKDDGGVPMRHKGRITTWEDDRGFGFITPIGGGDRVFVHIKSFTNRQRRPFGANVVTYDLKLDSKGRRQAANVSRLGDRTVRARSGSGIVPLVLAVLFIGLVATAVVAGKLPIVVLGLYVIGSLVTYVVYAWDKSSAKRNRWRIQESTLHLLSLFGGWPGAFVAQRTLRHKSKKRSFQLVFWITVILNCGALIGIVDTVAS